MTGNNNVTRWKSSETTIYLKQKNTTNFSCSFEYFFLFSPNQDYRLSDPIFHHPKLLSQLCSNAIFHRISTQLLIRFHSEFQRGLQYKFHQIADSLITNFNQISKNISLWSSISFYSHFFCIFIASLLDFSQI